MAETRRSSGCSGGVLLGQLSLYDPNGEALCRQQTGGGGADHASADDGDITLFHNLIPEKGRTGPG